MAPRASRWLCGGSGSPSAASLRVGALASQRAGALERQPRGRPRPGEREREPLGPGAFVGVVPAHPQLAPVGEPRVAEARALAVRGEPQGGARGEPRALVRHLEQAQGAQEGQPGARAPGRRRARAGPGPCGRAPRAARRRRSRRGCQVSAPERAPGVEAVVQPGLDAVVVRVVVRGVVVQVAVVAGRALVARVQEQAERAALEPGGPAALPGGERAAAQVQLAQPRRGDRDQVDGPARRRHAQARGARARGRSRPARSRSRAGRPGSPRRGPPR